MSRLQTISPTAELFEAYIIETYPNGTSNRCKLIRLPDCYDSWDSAKQGIKDYYLNNPPPGGQSYDEAGYIKKIVVKRAYNPRTHEEWEA